MAVGNTPQARRIEFAIGSLAKLNPPDDQVKAGAEKLYLTKRHSRTILVTLARNLQSKTKEVGIDVANLEHIFPQNPDEKDWPNLDELAPYTWHLGNLTILGVRLNRDAANKSYKTKVEDYYKASELEITKDVAKNYSEWTPESILARAKSLGEAIATAWPGPKAPSS